MCGDEIFNGFLLASAAIETSRFDARSRRFPRPVRQG
jgi:hypothetical protein